MCADGGRIYHKTGTGECNICATNSRWTFGRRGPGKGADSPARRPVDIRTEGPQDERSRTDRRRNEVPSREAASIRSSRFRRVAGRAPRHGSHAESALPVFAQWRRAILRRARERVDRMALREPLRWGACGYPLDGKCHHGSKQCFCRFAAVTICVKRALAPRSPSTIGSSTSRDRTRSLFLAGSRLAKPGHALFVPGSAEMSTSTANAV